MAERDPFQEVMARLRSGDDEAAAAVFQRFVGQLVALSERKLSASVRHRVDVEGAVQSAYRSFFRRQGRGEFTLESWDELWSLLAVITLRKCAKQCEKLHTARRDVAREVRWRDGSGLCHLDTAPSPFEAAMLAELVESLFHALDEDDRQVVEHLLAGYTAAEIAEKLDCSERTVRRVRHRAKSRLLGLVGTPVNGRT
jgi:RNA polymerase sigma factor (sigma-70 family)